MTLLQFLLIQANLVCFYAVYMLLDTGTRHRTFNRLYLLLAPILAVALPFVAFHSNEAVQWVSELPAISVLREQNLLDERTSYPIWPTLYLLGILFILALTAFKIVKAMRRPIAVFREKFRGISVYELREAKASYSFFRRIYVHPEQVVDERTVVLHEYAHCQGWHSLDLLICSIYRALFWINPVAILWERRMRENHEYIADQFVLANDLNPREYAHVLFHATFNAPAPPYVHTFENKSLLRKRIENLKFKNQHHMKHLLVIPALAGLGFLSVSMNTPAPVQPNGAQTTVEVKNNGEPDKPAEFKGGMTALSEFIGAEVKYPKKLQEAGVTGMAVVSFEIATNGAVEEVKLVNSSGNTELDNEAIRVVKAMPTWNPAEKEGKTVRSEMKLPFKFAI